MAKPVEASPEEILHFRSILWPTDFSECSTMARPYVEAISRAFTSRVTLLSVIEDMYAAAMLGEVTDSPIVDGWSVMFSGYPKTGKTELMVRLAAELSQTGLKVLYLTEEPESVWSARLSKLPVGFENVDLVYAMGASADEILEAINAGADDVVFLDTIRLLRLRDENDNSAINIALTRSSGRSATGRHRTGASTTHASVQPSSLLPGSRPRR